MADQARRRRAHHDARQVVVAEYRRLLHRPGGDDHRRGAQLVEAAAGDHGEPVVGVERVRHGAGHGANAGRGGDRLDKLRPERITSLAFGIETGVAERTPERRVFVGQDNLGAGLCGAERRRHARRAAPDNGHVAEKIGLVVISLGRIERHFAEARVGADQRFPAPPRAARPVERLVVEPDREETAQPIQQRTAVMGQAAGVVLAGHRKALGDLAPVGQHVGLAG